jgi:hypothetical protein
VGQRGDLPNSFRPMQLFNEDLPQKPTGYFVQAGALSGRGQRPSARSARCTAAWASCIFFW